MPSRGFRTGVVVLIGGGAALSAACNDSTSTTGDLTSNSSSAAVEPTLDFGEDWDTADPRGVSVGAAGSDSGPAWGIVLKTFPAEGHATSAATMLRQLVRDA